MLAPSVDGKLQEMLRQLVLLGDCVVAYSGGVDSAVVAAAAVRAVGERAVAVTAISPSLAEGESEAAVDTARQIGIRHLVLRTSELDRPEYVRNDRNRCYHCKTELYGAVERWLAEAPEAPRGAALLNGANADDLGDYRPGLRAAGEHGVRSPLAECGIGKDEVRRIAAHWGLRVWDKPASPCLSSRIAYGEEVTPERLRMVDRAEQHLRSLGISPVRVRYHRGAVARIEAPLEALGALSQEHRGSIVAQLREIGFQFVALDLEGFRSGSLNALLQIGPRSS